MNSKVNKELKVIVKNPLTEEEAKNKIEKLKEVLRKTLSN